MPKSSEKSYQEMRLELEEITAELQSTELDADRAVELYQKGLTIIKSLEAKLASAKNTVKKLKADFDKK